MSIEQLVRDILTQAIKDGLVRHVKMINADPQIRTSGELVGCANLVNEYISLLGKPQ